jgi:hypothetical protein
MSSGVALYTAATPAYCQFLSRFDVSVREPTAVRRSKVHANDQPVLGRNCDRDALGSYGGVVCAWVERIWNVAPPCIIEGTAHVVKL